MKTKALAAVLGFALMAVAVPARAEVVTMICGPFTLDIDLTGHTVFFASGGPSQATVPAQVTDRYIEFTNPFNPDTFKHRIDRSTGIIYLWIKDHGWRQDYTCQRVGKPVL